jgi:nicotinic acid mononucleotide adenylyltransferase
MGIDSLLQFSSWYKADKIYELANLIVIDRPAESFNFSESELKKDRVVSLDGLGRLGFSKLEQHQNLAQFTSGKFMVLKLPLHNISSTEIRSLIKKRENITHLVGIEVAEYIQTHKLYQ